MLDSYFNIFQREFGPVEVLLIKYATIIAFFLLIGFILFYSHIRRVGPEICIYIQDFFKRLKSDGGKFFMPLIIFVVLTLIFKIYLALTTPIHYDEAFTYLNFTQEGFLRSATFYPAPNNHILHSLLTNLSYYLPFSETFNLRLPVILVSSITTLLFFYCFTRLTSEKTAFIITLIFSFLNPVIYYGFNSRGYYLIILFFLISFYSVIQIIRIVEDKNETKKYYFFFATTSILGFYTMPSFLYPFLALASFLLIKFLLEKSLKKLKFLFFIFLSIALIVIILYTPIIIVSGIDALINNTAVEPISRREVLLNLFPHFKTTFQYLFNLNYKLTFLFLISVIILFLIKKFRFKEVLLIAFIIIFCPVILIIHSVIPFARTWIFLVIPVLYLLGLLLNFIEDKLDKQKFILPAIVLVSGMLFITFLVNIKNMESFSYSSKELSEYIIEKGAKKIYVEHSLVDINLSYLFKTEKKKIKIFENDPLLKREYDYLIFSEKIPAPPKFKYDKGFGKDIFVYQVIKSEL